MDSSFAEPLEWSSGEVCGVDNCPSTRYIENADGSRSCEYGHVRQEVLYAEEEYADPGGRTTRKKKEKAERTKLPSGVEQRRLLVNSLQWVLRKQIWWLIHEKNFPPEFEALVQDLWSVRRMELSELIDLDWTPEVGSEDHEKDESTANDGTNTESAQSGESDLEFATSGDSDSSAKMELSHRSLLKSLPSLNQGVALLYLACCILSVPVFLGDFIEWVNDGELPYRDVHNILPRDMWNRLTFQSKILIPSRKRLLAVRLQQSTRLLYRAYQDRLGLILPPLNIPLCLYRMVERLALPLDIYLAARRLGNMLRYKFEFPRTFKKNWEYHMPYLQIVEVLVIAVKLLYPFDMEMRHPRKKTEPTVAIVNWKVWLREKEKFDQEKFKYSPFTDDEAAKIREEDVAEMSDEMMDRYMDWFAERWIIHSNTQGLYERSNLRSNLNTMFPLDDADPSLATAREDSTAPTQEDSDVENMHESQEGEKSSPDVSEPDFGPNPSQSDQHNMKENTHLPRITQDERRAAAERLKTLTSERLDTVQNQLLVQDIVEENTDEDSNSLKRPGSGYRRFRRTEGLEGVAKDFHVAVAELVGMPLQDLLATVLRAESTLDRVWLQNHKRKMKRRKNRLYDLT